MASRACSLRVVDGGRAFPGGGRLREVLPPVVTVDEAAGYLRLCPQVVRALCAQGLLAARKAGRVWRISGASVMAFVPGGETA